jgi:hypothetical protein
VAIRIHPDGKAQNIVYATTLRSYKTISELNLIRYLKYLNILHQVSLFFRKSGATLAKALTVAILRFPENQNSAA